MSIYKTLLAGFLLLNTGCAAWAAEEVVIAHDTEVISTQTPAEVNKLDINSATSLELAKIPGMSPYKARCVVAYRKKNGDFKSLDQLKSVRGFTKMDKATLEAIKAQLTIAMTPAENPEES